jgi:hypothetical protein
LKTLFAEGYKVLKELERALRLEKYFDESPFSKVFKTFAHKDV